MTCLAGLLPAPASGCSPEEVEGISYGGASCSIVRGACRLCRADGLLSPGPLPRQFPRCSPVADAHRDQLLCRLGRAAKTIAQEFDQPVWHCVCVCSHVNLARGLWGQALSYSPLTWAETSFNIWWGASLEDKRSVSGFSLSHTHLFVKFGNRNVFCATLCTFFHHIHRSTKFTLLLLCLIHKVSLL